MKVPLDPQPDEGSIVVIKHYYNTLKASEKFKQRITWLEKLPTSMKMNDNDLNMALVEYIGEFPKQILHHGNSP